MNARILNAMTLDAIAAAPALTDEVERTTLPGSPR
jgi:hypothetical protein